MAEKGHTELPWFFGKTGEEQIMILGGETRSYVCNVQIHQSPRAYGMYAEEERKANANLIVTAVNTYPAVEGLVKALEGARQFITNGIELGYIRMPDSDTPDPAHQRLPQIEAALSRFRSLQNGGAE